MKMKPSIYSHLPNGMHEMKMEHVGDISDLLTEQFILHNQIWSSAKLNREQLKKFFVDSVQDHLNSQQYIRKTIVPNAVYNLIGVMNGRLTSCIMHYQISQYKKKLREVKIYEVQIYNQLQRQGRQLIKCVDLDSYQVGKYLSCSWMARKQLAEYSKARKVMESAQTYGSISEQGFKGMICRSSNIKIIGLMSQIGGNLLKESVINTDGKSFSLYFAMLDLQNEKLKDFVQMAKKLREEVTAKL